MKPFFALVIAGLRAFVRDRAALIWSFVLPVFLVLVFGTLFGELGKPQSVRFPVGLVLQGDFTGPNQQYTVQAFQRIPLLETFVGSEAGETAALRAGKRQAVLIFPPDFGARLMQGKTTAVRLLYDRTQPEQVTQPVRSALRQAVMAMDRQITGMPSLLEAQEEAVAPGIGLSAPPPRPLDYMLPGLFATTAMQLGLLTALPFIALRERGILKRFRSTPVPLSTVLAAQVVLRLIVALVQTTLLLLLGRIIFGFQMVGSPLVVLPVVLFGVLVFIGVAALVAAAAKTQEAGMSLVQIINLPLMLLSGLMIPLELLPTSLRPLIHLLPTTYFGDALRQLMLGSAGVFPLGYDLAILLLWFLALLMLAARTFRPE